MRKTVSTNLDAPCSRCGAEPGRRCRNYKGQNKQACPGRDKTDPPAGRNPPGRQRLLVNPGSQCENCKLPLQGQGCEHRNRSQVLVVCESCLAFLATLKADKTSRS